MVIDFFRTHFFSTLPAFSVELMYIDEYHQSQERYWNERYELLSAELDDQLAKNKEEWHEGIVDSYYEDFYITQNKYPSFHRETMLVSLYNQAEYVLERFTSAYNDEIAVYTGKTINFKRGNIVILDKLHDGFIKELEFDFSEIEPLWIYLKGIKAIRNRIVHENGMASKAEHIDEIVLFCNENDSFGITHNMVILRKGAVNEAIKNMRLLFAKFDVQKQDFVARYQTQYGTYFLDRPLLKNEK